MVFFSEPLSLPNGSLSSDDSTHIISLDAMLITLEHSQRSSKEKKGINDFALENTFKSSEFQYLGINKKISYTFGWKAPPWVDWIKKSQYRYGNKQARQIRHAGSEVRAYIRTKTLKTSALIADSQYTRKSGQGDIPIQHLVMGEVTEVYILGLEKN